MLSHGEFCYNCTLQFCAKSYQDPEVVKAAKLDELCHDHFTLEGASGAITRGRGIDAGKAIVSSPVRAFLLVHGKFYLNFLPPISPEPNIWPGTSDVVCDHDGARNWMENCCTIKDKEFKSYEGWMHKSESSRKQSSSLTNDHARSSRRRPVRTQDAICE